MDGITLRNAVAADQPAIRLNVVKNQLNPVDLRWQNFLVATNENGQFIGCGQIKHHGKVQELASLVVIDSYQGQGISRHLMDALMTRAGRPLWLMCESPLVGYYEQYGFKEAIVSTLPNYFQMVYWATRVPSALLSIFRGNYIAFMVCDDH